MYNQQLALWIALLSVPGVGLLTANRLFSNVQDWDVAQHLTVSDWMNWKLTEVLAQKIVCDIKNEYAWQQIESMSKQKIGTVMIQDQDYPALLRNIYVPPIALFYVGERPLFHTGVAIVGTRNATSYGKKVAFDLASFLSPHPIAVISGLAYGIDASAHQGTLANHGYTIAVLGSGVNQLYPKGNHKLANDILLNGGTILSEFLPDVTPHKAYFPMRNRIINGLSKAVVVVEAGKQSGALITAGHAVLENREVYAVPGSIYSAVSQGTHELLMDGAIPLFSFHQLLEDLNIDNKDDKSTVIQEGKDRIEDKICSELAFGMRSLADLHTILGNVNMYDLGLRLGEMELAGKLRRQSDGRYMLI